ncbi:toll/interleukin-1 receptor domain-containing protein [Nitrospirillum amazonense]|uniref:toll/interleukin-1 receptor domain-containing protein n=1 Tax=Nitrospirillum amazonense TaxID=28077 RepID=UPI002DD4267D|nr:toll/interleukin-1 receptor domain-containing protein [Nitrospirillum amazonense]MEC4594114.1 toll/interleukin-1 receptor domain-containing protein [Nitrospirillum amazonense]
MKVFISWSGGRSKSLALALRDWLPLVLQYVQPWVSDKDIGAGDRWAQSIASELESANFGIICITPENIHSEWILFEAGALSKSMLDAKVIPLLFNLELSDLSGPLSQFQAQKVEENGLMEVVKAINKVSNGQTSEQIVNRLVPQLWPSLQAELDNIPDTRPSGKHMRPQHEILEELVTGVRGLNARIRDFEPELLDRDRLYRRRRMRFSPRIIEEISGGEIDDRPTALLLIAGIVREDFPWLAELLLESYREIRDGGPQEAERAYSRIRRSLKQITRSGLMKEMFSNPKDTMFILEEIPMLLDITLRGIGGHSNQLRTVDEKEGE